MEINRNPTERQVRQFATCWLSGFCFVLAGASVYFYASWTAAIGLAGCGVTAVLLGVVRPSWMRFVFLGWMWAAFPIGWAIAHMLVAVVYFLVITPIGLVMRVFGHDPLVREFDPQSESYWIVRRQESDPASYFRQF